MLCGSYLSRDPFLESERACTCALLVEKNNCVGMGNLCDAADSKLFYTCTCITIDNGDKAPLWDAPWLDGRRPKDLAPPCLRGLQEEEVDGSLGPCWECVNQEDQVNLRFFHGAFIRVPWALEHSLACPDQRWNVEDAISWKFTASGIYSGKPAYEAQFQGATLT